MLVCLDNPIYSNIQVFKHLLGLRIKPSSSSRIVFVWMPIKVHLCIEQILTSSLSFIVKMEWQRVYLKVIVEICFLPFQVQLFKVHVTKHKHIKYISKIVLKHKSNMFIFLNNYEYTEPMVIYYRTLSCQKRTCLENM